MAINPKRLAGGTLTNAVATYYTAGTGVKARIEAFSLVNYSAGSATFSVYLVPAGGTADNTNILAKDVGIVAGGRMRLLEAIGQWIEPGGTVQAAASVGSAVTIAASGSEWTTA